MKKNEKRIVNKIEIELTIEGVGLVNYNSKIPPRRFYKEMLSNGELNENGSFAKENEYCIGEKDGKPIYIHKKVISSGRIRKSLLGDDTQANADMLCMCNSLRYQYLADRKTIARGFCLLKKDISNSENDINIKRKSAFTVTEAEQTCGAETKLETCTTTGARNNTSLFYKETCGEIKYKSRIFVDLKQLQFISTDERFDRLAITEKDVMHVLAIINKSETGEKSVHGNYKVTHYDEIGETGIMLSEEYVKSILREFITNMLNLHITKGTAYAKTEGIKISLGYKGDLVDLNKKANFVKINNIDDYDNIISNVNFVDPMEIKDSFDTFAVNTKVEEVKKETKKLEKKASK